MRQTPLRVLRVQDGDPDLHSFTKLLSSSDQTGLAARAQTRKRASQNSGANEQFRSRLGDSAGIQSHVQYC